jgi:hypothetical protein
VNTTSPTEQLELLGRKLRHLHLAILHAERQADPSASGFALLDRLINDPAWAWLRPLSALMAEIDHVLSQDEPATVYDHAVVAAHVRGLLSNEADLGNAAFLERYVPLLQSNTEIAGAHAELRSLLRTAPDESADESERLHARHRWAMRARHHTRGQD